MSVVRREPGGGEADSPHPDASHSLGIDPPPPGEGGSNALGTNQSIGFCMRGNHPARAVLLAGSARLPRRERPSPTMKSPRPSQRRPGRSYSALSTRVGSGRRRRTASSPNPF
jgi:hypothetical protein